MKIKTIVFWVLWVGNNLTSQTVIGDSLERVRRYLFPDDLDDVDLLCQTLGLSAPQNEQEQVQQLAKALRNRAETSIGFSVWLVARLTTAQPRNRR